MFPAQAPEVWSYGKTAKVRTYGIPADLFGVGCVLYELLLGRPPTVSPKQAPHIGCRVDVRRLQETYLHCGLPLHLGKGVGHSTQDLFLVSLAPARKTPGPPR